MRSPIRRISATAVVLVTLVACSGARPHGAAAGRRHASNPETRSTPASKTRALTGHSRPEASISDLTMVDRRHGWALVSFTSNARYVLRTSDGGRSWRDVTPRRHHRFANVNAFLDGRHAWVGLTVGSERRPRLRLLATGDGGRTWKRLATLSHRASLGAELRFVDPEHGWIVAEPGGAMYQEPVNVYATKDGGRTWRTVEHEGYEGSPVPNSPGSLVVSCDKTGATFVDRQTGWITANCAGGAPYLEVTHDGGHSWSAQRVPGFLHGTIQNVLTFPPVFASREDGAFVGSDEVGTRLLVTRDGGASWQDRPIRPNLFVDVPAGDGLSVLDARRVWVMGELPGTRVLLGSTDGGRAWHRVAAGDGLPRWPRFFSPTFGFATGFGELALTRDGGRTWTARPIRLAG